MKIFIGCSSSDEINKKYFKESEKFLSLLLEEHDLIFGVYAKGIMGLAYQIAQQKGRKIYGICREIDQEELNVIPCYRTILTKNVNERTNKLIKKADAIIILPGGIGTIHELISAIDSKRCGEMNKPIIICNINHYYDKMIDYLRFLYQEKFTDKKVEKCYYVTYSAIDAIDYLNNYAKQGL